MARWLKACCGRSAASTSRRSPPVPKRLAYGRWQCAQLAELVIDISGQESKTLERYLDKSFDQVITVCDQANEACPVFFGARERMHWSFPDPSKGVGSEEEQLAVYRQVRDAIRERIERELLSTRPLAQGASSGDTDR